MVTVKAFRIDGMRLYFPSNDHEPPHFHVKREDGTWFIKVYILESDDRMIEVIRPPDAKIRRTDRRLIIQGVKNHRIALLAEWEDLRNEK